jgi:hypothetical protein
MNNEQILGWFKFPEPDGTKYGKEDFLDKEKLEELFKYCQQGLGFVNGYGWQYLLVEYGLEGIMELDAQCKWTYDEDKGEWLKSIFFQSLTSGYDPESDEFGDYDLETKTFIYKDGTGREINWEEIYEFKNKM